LGQNNTFGPGISIVQYLCQYVLTSKFYCRHIAGSNKKKMFRTTRKPGKLKFCQLIFILMPVYLAQPEMNLQQN